MLTPARQGTTKAEVNTNGETSSSCKGIDWDLKFQNTVYLNALDLERFDLHKFEKPLANGCLSVPGLEGSSTTTTSPTATSTDASTTTDVSTTLDTTASTDSAVTEPSSTDTAPSTTIGATDLSTTTAAETGETSTLDAAGLTGVQPGTTTIDQTATDSEATAAASKAKRTVALDIQPRVPRLPRQENDTDIPFNSSAFTFVQDKENDFTDRQLETGFLKHAFKATDASNTTDRDPWEVGNLVPSHPIIFGRLLTHPF